MNDGGMFGFGRGAFTECCIDGFAQRVSALECFEEEEVFSREALVVDGVVVAVDRKVDLLMRWPTRTGAANEMDSDGVAGLRARVVRGVADRKEGVVDGVRYREEAKIGLKGYARVGVEVGDLVCCERWARFVVEGFDVGPLEGGHCDCGIRIGL